MRVMVTNVSRRSLSCKQTPNKRVYVLVCSCLVEIQEPTGPTQPTFYLKFITLAIVDGLQIAYV